MTQETAGFVPSFGKPKEQVGSPLIRFRGTLKEYQPVKNEEFNRTSVRFSFTDVEVIETSEPYNFPIATLNLGYSERANTKWSVFAESVRNLLGDDAAPSDLVGKEQEWYYAPCQIRMPGPDGSGEEQVWKLRDSQSWTLAWIEGADVAASGVSLDDAILDLLDGKTEAQFQQAVFGTEAQGLKKLPGWDAMLTGIMDRQFFPAMEAGGKAIKDADGVWHKA